MKITSLAYEKLVSFGSYNHETVKAECAVRDNEDPQECFLFLQGFVGTRLAELESLRKEAQRLREEEQRLRDEQWRRAYEERLVQEEARLARLNDMPNQAQSSNDYDPFAEDGTPLPWWKRVWAFLARSAWWTR